MAYFAGIDVGSLSTDVVILDEKGVVAGYSIIQTGANSTEAAEKTSIRDRLFRTLNEKAFFIL